MHKDSRKLIWNQNNSGYKKMPWRFLRHGIFSLNIQIILANFSYIERQPDQKISIYETNRQIISSNEIY